MKIIPRKLKVKNTIWKFYNLIELIIILILLLISFILLTNNNITIGIILTLVTILLFMPVSDDLLYYLIYEFIKYIFSNKVYYKRTNDLKKDIKQLITIKQINEDGTIKYGNNSYSKVIKIGQKNFLLQDEETQEVDIEIFNKALKQLDILSPIDIVKIDQPINFDKYIKDLDNKLTVEKTNIIYNNSLSTKEKILLERKRYIELLNNNEKQYVPNYYIVLYSNTLKDLENILENFVYEIKKLGVSVKKLDMYETAIFLKYSYSRDFDEREAYKLNQKDLINWIYPNEIRFFSNKYTINNIEASTLTISNYPLKVKNGWGNNIFNIDNTKVIMRIKQVDKYKAIRKIDKCIMEMESKQSISSFASEANSSEIHKNTMYDLLNNLQAEDESLLDVNITITSYNYDHDINYRRNIKRKINTEGFRIVTLLYNQINGFILSSINNYKNKLTSYTTGINSKTLSASFPFLINHLMDDDGIVLGKSLNKNYPFIFNIWKKNELYQNSNMFILGKSGSGKTYFVKNLLLNEWSNDTRIIICDPECEYTTLTKNLNGNIIDVGNSKEGMLNPFHVYKILTEDGIDASSLITFNTHLKTLESFFKIVLNDLQSDLLELINMLVIETYKYKGIDENTDFSKLKNSDYPIFSDLLYVLENKINSSNLSDLLKEKYQILHIHIQKFTSGRYSDIWNNPSTLELDANIINFNFQSLFLNKNNIVTNAQMLLIFRFIEQEIINKRKQDNNKKTMIIVDEAHMFIDIKYPIALDFFYQMNKRIRKYNGSFVPITQNISDWSNSLEIRHKTSTIIKNSQYTFIFKSSSPDMQDILEIYKAGNSFNKEERKIIISAATGQAFFIGSTELRFPVKITCNDKLKYLIEG